MANTPINLVEWIEPITDRSQTDIDRLAYLKSLDYNKMTPAQREEWEQDSKGALNLSDLVRILNNIALLYETFGFTTLKHLSPKVGLVPHVGLVPGAVEFADGDESFYRSVPEIPTYSFYTELLLALTKLKSTMYVYQSTPTVPSHPLNTFEKWNDIEKILYDVHDMALIVDYDRSGIELYAGQAIGVM